MSGWSSGLDREPLEGFGPQDRAARRVSRPTPAPTTTDDGRERLVLSMRTHPKVLAGPLLLSLLLLLGAAVVVALVPQDLLGGQVRLWGSVFLFVVAVVLPAGPLLSWWFTRYQVTTHRISYRTGVLSRRGKAVPLGRITDVSFDQSMMDRLFGCGTLMVADPASHNDRGLEFTDVPHVHRVHEVMTDLVFEAQGLGGKSNPHAIGFADDGTG